MNARQMLHFSGHRFLRMLAVVIGLAFVGSSARADVVRSIALEEGDTSAIVTIAWDMGTSVPDSSLLIGETIASSDGVTVALNGEVGKPVEAIRQDGAKYLFLIAHDALSAAGSFSYRVAFTAPDGFSVSGNGLAMDKAGTTHSYAIGGASSPNLPPVCAGDSNSGIVASSLTIRGFSLETRNGKSYAQFQWSGSGAKPVQIQWAPSLKPVRRSPQPLGSKKAAIASPDWKTLAVVTPTMPDVKEASGPRMLSEQPAPEKQESVYSYTLETTSSQGFFRLLMDDDAEEE